MRCHRGMYIILKRSTMLFIIPTLILISACSDHSKEEKARSGANKSDEQGQISEADTLITFYQIRIKRDPANYFNYTKLGETYIQKARESGDLSYYDKAEEVLKKSLQLYPDSHATLLYLGQVSSSRHEFHETLGYAKKAMGLKPEESSPYAVLGDAYLELGEYDKAREAYEKMLSLGPSLYSYGRISHVKDLTGDREGAIEAME
jgi:tetratricopeptide (TPR) repeat protein